MPLQTVAHPYKIEDTHHIYLFNVQNCWRANNEIGIILVYGVEIWITKKNNMVKSLK